MFGTSQDTTLTLADALAGADRARREEAKEYLFSRGLEAVPILHELLGDTRFRVRWEAALVLKKLAHPACVDSLLEALKDEDEDVRWVAAEGLGNIGKPCLRPFLLFLIRESDSFEVRDAAHVAISYLVDADAKGLLKPVHQALVHLSPPETIIAAANRALEELGNEAGEE